jgi:hypothetical protein
MEKEDALDLVTEVEVSASEKKILDDYEPFEGQVSYTATVPEEVDVEEVQQTLADLATQEAKMQVMQRYESYIRKDMDDE